VDGYAVNLLAEEKRYDIGAMNAYYEAFIDFALSDTRYGYQLRQYLVKKLMSQEEVAHQ
jgi:UTP-glucose-1-phosphate uridylyltransferase